MFRIILWFIIAIACFIASITSCDYLGWVLAGIASVINALQALKFCLFKFHGK